MKENENSQIQAVRLPPTWCASVCRNAMNEKCIELCNPKRDTSGFEIKPGLTLIDMPRFPETAGMTREEKFTSVTVYLAKVVNHLKGEENVTTYPIRRPHVYNTSNSPVSSNIPIQSILHGISETIAGAEIGKESADTSERSSEVAQPAD